MESPRHVPVLLERVVALLAPSLQEPGSVMVDATLGLGGHSEAVLTRCELARVVGIDAKTLRKHYRDELDLGAVKANAQVAGFLFNSARNGNVTAQIFWLKTRARWKEAPSEHHVKASLAHCDVRDLNTETLQRIAQGQPVNWSDPDIFIHRSPGMDGPVHAGCRHLVQWLFILGWGRKG